MAALFPPWANTATHVVLVVLGLGVAAAIAAPMIYARSPFATGAGDPVVQPILFDHRHHVRDDGIDCLYCHEGAERSPLAGVPAADRCLGCHDQIWNDAAELAPLRAAAATGAPIHWRQVHALPDFVYFDHAIHARGGVGCVTCHGRVDEMAAVVQVAPLTMHWCLDCHRDPAPHLRPRAELTSMTWTPPAGARIAAPTRSLTHCSACHR